MGCANSKQTETITAAEPVMAQNGVEKRAAPVDAKPAPSVATSVNPSNPNSFEEQYALGKTIGSGTFSIVREAIHKPSGQKYAIKCIKREGLTAEDIEALTTEVAILKQMNHPNIMILHDFFQEDKFYFLVTEFMEGGELFDRIVEKEDKFYFLVTEFMEGGELFDRIVEKSYYSEREARDLVKLLLESIKYCHDANVVHRDLKPENLLLTSKDDDASIKLADFGFAKKIEFDTEGLATACGTPGYLADFGFAKKIEFDTEGLATACGTPGYVAPEILEGQQYGKSVDIWSIGVITYILLCGYPPFHDDNHNALFKKIKRGKYQFDSPYWDHVSDDAKDLIGKMLVVNPTERWTATQLLEHKWVTGRENIAFSLDATAMYSSWTTDLHEYHAHQRKIVRHFAPHMSNEALAKQERVYLLIGLAQLVVVFALPSAAVLSLHDWFVKTPVFVLIVLVCLVELVMAFIEVSEDCYKLKILGYYHRKIAKFVGSFPATMSSSDIRRYYRTRGILQVSLFSAAYITGLSLLLRSSDDDVLWLWILYLLTIGSGLVVFRFLKMHFVELPQVLILRDHPEFALAMTISGETIPFARPVATYNAAPHAIRAPIVEASTAEKSVL
ncbi:hypothetical protein ATCC90586_006929 [Pythium insidiosum]|nr:hypothetical protein ATCC90586_006929 [Pythium insidiosum]